MPYRRLPNTDEARLRALKKALKKAESVMPHELAFNAADFVILRRVTQALEHAMIGHKQTYGDRVKNNKKYIDSFRKAKLYISHFIQVLNLSIIRNEIPKTARKFYNLDTNDKTVPPLTSETEVLAWGKYILDGEKERTAKGGSPIYNPKIALVKVEYEKFADAYHFQKTLQDIHDRSITKLSEVRKEADDLIVRIWDVVEKKFDNYDYPEIMRQQAEEYGVVYVFRKKEKLLFDL